MSPLPVSAPQTVGPFFSGALLRDDLSTIANSATQGERVRIEGRVLDGDGEPVADALVEIWQANAYGRYNHPLDTSELPLDEAFSGFGRCGTDDAGWFRFETIKPGRVPDGDGRQAPHLNVTLMARGLLCHLNTRIYFAGDPQNDADRVLQRVPANRRGTLLAQRSPEDDALWRLDIRLQGADETVFFDF